MLSQIQDRDIVLQEAHHELEVKVRERTHDLENEIQIRRKSESALRDSEERLRSILDHATTVVYMKDIDLHYVLVNRQFERVFNVTNEQVRGKTYPQIFPKDLADRFTSRDNIVLESGQPESLPQKLRYEKNSNHSRSGQFRGMAPGSGIRVIQHPWHIENP